MKKKNIQSILTINFISLILLVTGITSVFFAFLQYRTDKTSAVETLKQNCSSLGDNIDLQISQLDTVVLGAINSNDLKESVESYSSVSSNSMNHLILRQKISSLLTSLKGFDYTIKQLSIYSSSGTGYGVGEYIGEYENFVNDDWYIKTLDEEGRKYIPPIKSEDDYFAICRAYYDPYHRITGVIEARKRFAEVFSAAENYNEKYNATIIVYDENGNVLYPIIKPEDKICDYLSYFDSDLVEINNETTNNKEIVTYYKTKKSKLTIVMAVENRTFLWPIFQSLIPVVLIFILAIIAGSIVAFKLSKGISTPIQKIYAFLSLKGLFHNARLNMTPTGIVEVDQLTESINEYLAKSEEQTKKIVTLHEQEVQAQMLALQSQMNPHFLYNSLASIAEMAREGLTDQVKTMTVNISQILRYISSNKEQVTTIEEELELCDMYLECMKLRFSDDLIYEFDVEDEMLDYMIPKLCIQLLVENAIKSVTTQSPPWKIRVFGYVEGDNWYIEVQDNGPGWDPEVDKKLRSQMDKILETRTLPSLKIEGMGVLNIFIRFYLLDGISFLFDFGNREEGGAFVKVGRKKHEKDRTLSNPVS